MLKKIMILFLLFTLNAYGDEQCDAIKSELSAIDTLQLRQQVDGKNMSMLRAEHTELLKEKVFIEGIHALVKKYEKAANGFVEDITGDNTKKIEDLILSAKELLTAQEELKLVHSLLGGASPIQNFSVEKMRSDIEKFEKDFCSIPLPKCNLISGLSDSIDLLDKNKEDKQTVNDHVQKAKEAIATALHDHEDVSKHAEALDEEMNNLQTRIQECVQNTLANEEASEEDAATCIANEKADFSKTAFDVRGWLTKYSKFINVAPRPTYVETTEKLKSAEAEKLYKEHDKQIKKELLDVIKAQHVEGTESDVIDKKVKEHFTKFYQKYCKDSETPESCLAKLNPQVVTKDLNAINAKMKKLENHMDKLKAQDLYDEIRKIKMAIISKYQSSCMGEPQTVNCNKKKVGTFGNFLNFGAKLTVEVQDPGFLKSGIVSPSTKIYDICRANEIINKTAPTLCKESKAKVKKDKNYELYHSYTDKKGKVHRSARESNSSIAFTAFAQTAVNGIPEFLALDNMRHQNTYMYDQGIMQKNMNYMTQQQNDWYMQNYALYGADPYSMGYDPFYSATFQFGNPNFALYNGYYAY